MLRPALPLLLAALLAGCGTYGVLARRNAVLMLIGVELLLGAAGLILVTAGQVMPDPLASGPVLTIFVITIAAAEIAIALAVVMAMYRTRGDIDLAAEATPEPDPEPDPEPEPDPAPGLEPAAEPEPQPANQVGAG